MVAQIMRAGVESNHELLHCVFAWLSRATFDVPGWLKAQRIAKVLSIDAAFGDESLGLEFEFDGRQYLAKAATRIVCRSNQAVRLDFIQPQHGAESVVINAEERTMTMPLSAYETVIVRYTVSLCDRSSVSWHDTSYARI